MAPLRSVLGTPYNGFVRSSLTFWAGDPLMVDLTSGEVRWSTPASAARSSLTIRGGLAAKGPVYLPLPNSPEREGQTGDFVMQCVEVCARAEVDVVLQVAVADLAKQSKRIVEASELFLGGRAGLTLVLDPLSLMACCPIEAVLESLDGVGECLPEGLAKVLLVPLLGGLATRGEIEELVVAVPDGMCKAVVPIQAEGSPRVLRAIADWSEGQGLAMDEERVLRLFHNQPPSRKAVSRMVARRGAAWWFEPYAQRGLNRMTRHQFIFSQLALVAELGRWMQLGTGFIEGHSQAARRIDAIPHDLVGLLREGNLELLDWLDGRVKSTLSEWALASPDLSAAPPLLTRLRRRFVADSCD